MTGCWPTGSLLALRYSKKFVIKLYLQYFSTNVLKIYIVVKHIGSLFLLFKSISCFISDQNGHHSIIRKSFLRTVGLPSQAEQRVQQLQQQRKHREHRKSLGNQLFNSTRYTIHDENVHFGAKNNVALVFINFDFRCISNTRFNFSLARVLIIGLINYTLVWIKQPNKIRCTG